MVGPKTTRRLSTLVIAGLAAVLASPGLAVEQAAKAATTTAASGTPEAAPADAPKKEKKVRFKKSKQVDFSNQTVEGKLHRPEASLVTASEGVNDNGLLRLREDFLDKFTAFAGEEIQQ